MFFEQVKYYNYVNVGNKTLKRLRKKPYNIANIQPSNSTLQQTLDSALWVIFRHYGKILFGTQLNSKSTIRHSGLGAQF